MNLSTSSSSRLITVYFALCAGVFALLAIASEWLVRTQVIPQDTLERHVELFTGTRSPYAAFGDSHVARGFNASAPVVNLAYPSENLERMIWKAKRYLARVEAPRQIVIQADPHLFSLYRLDAGLTDYPEQFTGAGGAPVKAFSKRYRPQLFALWEAYIINGGRIISSIEQTPQGSLLSPGNYSAWPAAKREWFAARRVELHKPIVDPQLSETAVQYQKMLEAFVARGAEVCLVAFPVSPLYRERVATLGAEEKKLWQGADAFYMSLTDINGVKYLDHRAVITDPTMFRDADHLNKKGAIAYSPSLHEACFEEAGR